MESAIEPSAMDRMRNKVVQEEALGAAHTELAALDTSNELQALEREERIEQVLTELRRKATSTPE
jgi:phage shock protein A